MGKNFDTIHNTITQNALSVGKQTVINGTPMELTRAILASFENVEPEYDVTRQYHSDGTVTVRYTPKRRHI